MIFNVDNDLPHFIFGDQVRLAQILNNLISNAIKFTDKGSVTVQVSEVDRNDNMAELRFSIKDTGIGILQKEKKLIFDRFEQAKSDTTRIFGGSGLGLTITKHLLELQESKIELTSTSGEGSEFYFNISFRIDDTKSSDDSKDDDYETGRILQDLKVLLVEDNELNLKVSQRLLDNLDIKVISARNGQEAVSLFKNEKFDLVLMDLHMPVMDGFEATDHIMDICHNNNRQVPIIALSADVMPETKDRIIDSKMAGYIIKPIDPKILKSKIIEVVTSNSNV
ncbi:ATP-binding protein [Bacteroidota bacterium]